MKKLLTLFTVAVMAFAVQANVLGSGLSSFLPAIDFTYEMGQESPVEEGVFIVLIDQDGNEVQYSLYPSPNYQNVYVTMACLDDSWRPYDPNNEERPNVPFYFIVNGERLGAEADMTPFVFFASYLNYQTPLFATDFCYTVPVGYIYSFGVLFADDGNRYLLVQQGPIPLDIDGVDELNADKAIASVRYYNMAGQEMRQAEGLTIVVTTYIDGTSSAVKVIK